MTPRPDQEIIIPASEINSHLFQELAPISEKLARSKAMVFFDLDKTAIDTKYNPTNLEGLRAVIDSLQQKGVVVGIHSDTPLVSMMQFAEKFGVKGPLIYEMGGIYFQEENINLVLDPEAMTFFTGFRNRFFEAVEKNFLDTDTDKYLLTRSNDRNKEKGESFKYPEYDRGIFINPFRTMSFGLWAEGIERTTGATRIDQTFHERVDDLVKTILIKELGYEDEKSYLTDYDHDRNVEYGVTIVKKRSLSSKTTPFKYLFDLVPKYNNPVVMCGDSEADFIDDARVATLGVANAKDELKDLLAGVTITLPFGLKTNLALGIYTDGLIEHLSAIDQALNLN